MTRKETPHRHRIDPRILDLVVSQYHRGQRMEPWGTSRFKHLDLDSCCHEFDKDSTYPTEDFQVLEGKRMWSLAYLPKRKKKKQPTTQYLICNCCPNFSHSYTIYWLPIASVSLRALCRSSRIVIITRIVKFLKIIRNVSSYQIKSVKTTRSISVACLQLYWR